MNKITLHEVDFLIYREGSGNTIEIYDIAVNSERGIGRGTMLFEELKRVVDNKRIFAITRKENLPAQAFYQSLGFIGYDLPRLYPDGDAMIYIYERS